MTFDNPLTTTVEEQFVVGESDFAFFDDYAYRCEAGAILLCRKGSAETTVNQYRSVIRPGSLVLVLPGTVLLLTRRTADFRMSYCVFSRELFAEAGFRLDPDYFRVMAECPISNPPARILEGALHWFRMAEYTYRDRGNKFRNIIIKNRLQNVLLEICDKIQRFSLRRPQTSGTTNRQTELFHRFVALVHEHCTVEREVAFYADRLCISSRSLSTIVRNIAHRSAKELIDAAAVLEIKMLLQTTDLSVQEIAYRLRFPDQSYLGRYFRKHAGVSPTDFRSQKK